jgi:HSP20 family protein
MALNKKRSFFDRLSGGPETLDAFEDEVELPVREPGKPAKPGAHRPLGAIGAAERDPGTGELPVDVHQTPSEIVIRAFVAGVRPDELNISISRDMVVIEGSRMERSDIAGGDYFTQELFWGSFARTILLPEEVDVDNSSASAKEGLLTVILPKLDKARQTKLRVKIG